MMQGIKYAIIYGVALIAVVLLLAAIPLYTDMLWFQDLGYGEVFSKILLSKVLLGVCAGLLFFLLVWSSAWYALRSNAGRIELYTMDANLPIFLDRMIRRGVEFVTLLGAIIISIVAGLEASTHWESWIQFQNYVPFGKTDPVFGIDIGFYFFKLEFWQFIYRTAMYALVAAGVAAAAILYLTRTVDLLAGKLKITNVAAGQLGLILALVAALQAVGFRLRAYEILYADNNALFGGGYTDINVRLLGLNLAIVACLAGAVLVIVGARRKSLPYAATGLVLGIAVNFIFGQAVAAVVQRVVVNPDELRKETPYIKRHIESTQYAYGLSSVVRKPADISGRLTAADISKNRVTLQSARLWDYRQTQSAFGQLQDIQQYYTFSDVDLDRYTVNGVYRQVMLAARELNKGALPETAQTWVNLKLKYTHGYGVSMSPVNEVTSEGLPRFFIKDIPPVSSVGLELKQPQIYFGERTSDYVVVNTPVKEFDHPSGDQGVYRSYTGDSGVRMGNLFRRALLALRFGDLNLALPGNIKSDSRILFRRNISERAEAIAPFLRMDQDPYIVLADGKLFWIQDAYTTSDKYPYSYTVAEKAAANAIMPRYINYVRNSVKIVTNAYTGDVNFYVFDKTDPVLKCYSKAFPGMFKAESEMPKSLRSHVRYPEDLFRLQTGIFQTFHMNDVQQFYNKGDVWAIPSLEEQDGAGEESRAAMEPYYVIMKLPDADAEEFILLVPYARAGKDNMVAWMAAKCDRNYGKLILYEFPKGEQFFGPSQIQARANQNTEISEQMTLWNQQKSRVTRGNLLVIPIEKSVVYIEPIYLQSTTAKIPEFKRVIVAHGDQITMQPTLADALNVLFGEGSGMAGEQGAPAAPAGSAVKSLGEEQVKPGAHRLILKAYHVYNLAVSAQKRGDWAEYGRRQEELGALLKQLSSESRQ